jgi:hypothetical protein
MALQRAQELAQTTQQGCCKHAHAQQSCTDVLAHALYQQQQQGVGVVLIEGRWKLECSLPEEYAEQIQLIAAVMCLTLHASTSPHTASRSQRCRSWVCMRASMLTLLHQYIPIPSSAKELVPCRMRAMLWGALDAHHTDCGMVAHVRCHENLAWHVALHIQL